MTDNELVLAREPTEIGRKNITHLISETDDLKHALCAPGEKYPFEGRVLDQAVWIVRVSQDEDIPCSRCATKSLQLPLKALTRRGVDWLDKWLASQGEYHYSDPRGEKGGETASDNSIASPVVVSRRENTS